MAAAEFVLNTSSMDEAASSCQKLAQRMKDLKDELNSAKDSLLFTWEGKGCNEFEKQYRLLTQQLSDITDNLWDTAEKIITAEESYIQADTDAAKQLEGKSYGTGAVDLTDEQFADVFE